MVSPHCTVSFSRAFPKQSSPADPAAAGNFHTNVLKHLRVLETKLSFLTHLLTRLYSLACDGSPACPVPPTRTRNHGITCTPLNHQPSGLSHPRPADVSKPIHSASSISNTSSCSGPRCAQAGPHLNSFPYISLPGPLLPELPTWLACAFVCTRTLHPKCCL